MTDLKISELSSNDTLDGTELIPLVQSGGNVKALLSAVKTFITNGLATTSYVTTAITNCLTPTINTQTGMDYTLGTVTTDNDGKTYVRMTSGSANTVTIPTTLTKPISISQRGAGVTTLVAGSGVDLNGTLAFTAQHQTKTVIPLGQVGGTGNYRFDIVG